LARGLLDLRFFELDVLAHDGIIFAEAQLVGLGPRILLRDVEEAGIGAADELDFDGCWLGHGSLFEYALVAKNKAASPPLLCGERLPATGHSVKRERVNDLVTMEAHLPLLGLRSPQMRDERDAMMLVRAEMCERLSHMQSSAKSVSLRDLAESVGTLRNLASTYGMTPVVRLVEALERAMAQDRAEHATSCPTRLYLERLQDAIGCGAADEQASQAMIASVSVRLSA
jgi:hypothetical protein